MIFLKVFNFLPLKFCTLLKGGVRSANVTTLLWQSL